MGILLCCWALSACGESGSAGPQEAAASQAPPASATAKAAAKPAGYDPVRLRELVPHEPERYLAWLPESIAGLPLNGAANLEGGNGVAASYHHEGNRERRVALELIDGAGDRGMAHLNAIHRMISLDIDQSSDGVTARTFERDGLRYLGKERARSGGTDAELEWIWSGRYHLKLSGKEVDLDSLVEAAGQLNARDL
jgi:hypothetical protein